jgi:hypothetical protein
MKTRRHHNNKGLRQIRRGKTAASLRAICKRLALPFRVAATIQSAAPPKDT